MCEQGRPWPFPFPDDEPGEIDESEFRADVEALRT